MTSRRIFFFLGLGAVVSCTPPPAAPTAGPTAAEIEQARSANESQAMAQMQAAHQEAVALQVQAQAATLADQKKHEDASRAMVEQAEADRRAAEAAKKQRCADTRVDRVNHVKAMAKARLEAEIRILRAAKAIRAYCRITTRRTGAMMVQRSGAGWRVSPELAQDLSCTGLPSGISRDDAYVILERDRMGIPSANGVVLEPGDTTPEDAECAPLDREVGVDFGSLRFEDDSIPKLGAWKPAEPLMKIRP